MPATPSELPRELSLELLWIAAAGAVLLLVMSAALSAATAPGFAARWLPVALTAWAFVIWQCRGRLHRNHSAAGGPLYRSLGHGTRITLLRGLLIAATAGFLATAGAGTPSLLLYVPAILYTAAALGDALDGHVARRQQHTTRLGEELDTELDALGLLVAPLLAVLYGKLHVSYLLVSIAYYLFRWGQHWRRSHGRSVYPLPPSRWRRPLAGLQMALVATALWPPLPAELTRACGFVLMLPLLIGFCRDWLYVSGRCGAGRETVT